jgi:hypothetical protein
MVIIYDNDKGALRLRGASLEAKGKNRPLLHPSRLRPLGLHTRRHPNLLNIKFFLTGFTLQRQASTMVRM